MAHGLIFATAFPMNSSPQSPVVAVVAQFPMAYFEAGVGGRGGGQAATWLPQLAEAWKDEQDFEIHWLVLDDSVEEHVQCRHLNQVFHRIPHGGTSMGLLLGRWPQRRGFRRVLREIRPSLVHCWGTENLHGAALGV